MTGSQVIERAVAAGHLAQSRELALTLYAQLEELVDNGYDLAKLRDELDAHFQRYRAAGDTVPRDAVAEVLDEIDERLAA